jgi:hypothetical protein
MSEVPLYPTSPGAVPRLAGLKTEIRLVSTRIRPISTEIRPVSTRPRPALYPESPGFLKTEIRPICTQIHLQRVAVTRPHPRLSKVCVTRIRPVSTRIRPQEESPSRTTQPRPALYPGQEKRSRPVS